MESTVKDAERVARLEQALRRCLELLDSERREEARRELLRALDARPEPAGLGAEVTDLELERAFDRAHPVADEVVDADRVAHEAIREVDRQLLADAGEPPPAFATGTMAELLERQGDRAGAERILDRLERGRGDSQGASASDRRGRVVRELERWLANLRTEG